MITALYRYPVKGLTAEALDAVELSSVHGFVGDRMVAIRRTARHSAAPEYGLPKNHFLMLMRDESLALLDCQFIHHKTELIISKSGKVLVAAPIQTAEGRKRIEKFFYEYLGDDSLNPMVVHSEDRKFTDISRISDEKMRAISLINVNSVKALEQVIGRQVDLRRFRANIYFSGVPAWQELNWVGKAISIGEARAEVVMRTTRCAATQVNPDTGDRDLNVPKLLHQHFGHRDMGIYAEISRTGNVAIGDQMVVLKD